MLNVIGLPMTYLNVALRSHSNGDSEVRSNLNAMFRFVSNELLLKIPFWFVGHSFG